MEQQITSVPVLQYYCWSWRRPNCATVVKYKWYNIMSSPLFFRIIPSSYSLTTVTPRWCPCGFAVAWRRDELSRLRDTSDVLLLMMDLDVWAQTWNIIRGSSTSICTVQVTSYTWTIITRCWTWVNLTRHRIEELTSFDVSISASKRRSFLMWDIHSFVPTYAWWR